MEDLPSVGRHTGDGGVYSFTYTRHRRGRGARKLHADSAGHSIAGGNPAHHGRNRGHGVPAGRQSRAAQHGGDPGSEDGNGRRSGRILHRRKHSGRLEIRHQSVSWRRFLGLQRQRSQRSQLLQPDRAFPRLQQFRRLYRRPDQEEQAVHLWRLRGRARSGHLNPGRKRTACPPGRTGISPA